MSESKQRYGVIYCIECLPTGKKYIGQTITKPSQRKARHFSYLDNNMHSNPYLQAAYNKYGRRDFKFYVLEKGICPLRIDEREVYWISNFKSTDPDYGFNLKPGGKNPGFSPMQIPTIWAGIKYPSRVAAARALGFSDTAIQNRIAKGYTSEDDMLKNNEPKQTIWNGLCYPSISACARALGLSYYAVWLRVKRGYTSDSDVPDTHKATKVTWNGEVYKSYTSAATAIGVSDSAVRKWIKKGYTKNSDIKVRGNHNKKAVIVSGDRYESIKEAANAQGVSVSTMRRWIKREDSDASFA